ncbi:hypothetical protein [Streptomyces alfalfae]
MTSTERAQWQAEQDAKEAAWERELEWRQITRKLEALYGAVRAGEGTEYSRQRIRRLEALQAALQGFPEALAA